MSEAKELKPGEREPEGKDGPRVGYATGKTVELLLGLHPEDRAHVVDALNKFELLSKGESKYEKDQEADRKKRQDETEKWVKESKLKRPDEVEKNEHPKGKPK
jgi:hypothetical protein